MKLSRLVVDNFRQFYGRQSMALDGGEKNVTIIYGANGAGKTTLLNAFTWALYKQLGADFEHPDQLINHRAWDETAAGSTATTTVTVEFEHDGRRYTAIRSTEARKSPDGEPVLLRDGDLVLRYIDEVTGQSGEYKNPANTIDQILPERLHRFFFFNGERIEHLVQATAYEEIETAIKTLLGLEIVDRARRHLDDAVKTLQRRLRKVGSGESQHIVDELERLKSDAKAEETSRDQVSERIRHLREEREAANNRLRSMENTRTFQERRDQLEKRISVSREHEQRLRSQLSEELAEKAVMAFTASLEDEVRESIEENRQKGELPAPLKRQFVEDLLENGKCICGTDLVSGEPHYLAVAEWRRRAGVADVEESLISVAAQTKYFSQERDSLLTNLARISADVSRERTERSGLEEELDEVSAQLKDLPLEEANQLESRREDIERQIEDLALKRAQHEAELGAKESTIRVRERDLARLQQQNQEAILAQRRATVATEARDLLSQLHEMRTHDVRLNLDRLIREVYDQISFKPYRPELTEDFQLQLRDPERDGALAPKSTGENQILSLSFVGALAETARRKAFQEEDDEADSGLLGFEGGTFPVVMDAAFGALDENYRREVARALPQLADQVVILVSRSQGEGPVHEELLERVANQYVINYHTPKSETEDEVIALNGREYPYITRDLEGKEWASLERVKE